METQRFTRNPVEVEAVQVTPTNVAEVAKWCKGTHIETDYWLMGRTHKLGAIQLTKQGPKSDKTMTVLIGSWITRHKNIFKAWKHESFEQVYTPVGGGFAVGDLVRATNDSPFNGWEGKVADPHLVGVDFGSRGRIVFEPSWLGKIDEMDSIQLELNAGVEFEQSGDPVKSVLDEMRAASREKIEAMERENLAYDPNDATLRVGDLVKIRRHPDANEDEVSGFEGQCGHIDEISFVTYTVSFATDDPEQPEKAAFHFKELEKLRQDGEALNLAEQDENDLAGWESSDLDRLNDEKREEARAELAKIASDRPWEGVEGAKPHELNDLVKIVAERSPYVGMEGKVVIIDNANEYIVDVMSCGRHRFTWDELVVLPKEIESVSLNDLREDLGMARVPELEGVAPDERALENYRIIKESLAGMTPEEAEKTQADIVELQDLISRTMSGVNANFEAKAFADMPLDEHPNLEEKPLTLADFSANDMVENKITYELDGVKLPAGTTGKITVVGCDLEGSYEPGVEVLFADGRYGYFLPIELKKI